MKGYRAATYFPDPSSSSSMHGQGSVRGQRTPSRRTSAADQTASYDRTPTKNNNMANAESTASSPGVRRGMTLPPSERGSTSSGSTLQNQQRGMSTSGYASTSGYGSTSHAASLTALGLGNAGSSSSKIRPDGALSSPRRISTSHPPVAFARRSQSPAPLAPSHEAYYSQTQPPTASTPRFRQQDMFTHSQGGSPRTEHNFLQPALGQHHRRQQSNGSGLMVPGTGPSSPVGSVFKTLRKQASNIGLSLGKPGAYDDDDARKDSDTEDDEPARTANGQRVWYSSYVTIDWLHDAVSTLRITRWLTCMDETLI